MAIAKIIKYEGDNNTFIWKHPSEDFNNMTQLIVAESQEAIFFMNGMTMDTFGPGKYNLDTESLPILGKFIDVLTYGESSFHAVVYFINKSVQMALKWGTMERVRFIEPNTGIPLDIGASGEMNLQVKDSKKLLLKLVGTMRGISWDKESGEFTKSLQNSFRPLISSVVKTNLAQMIKQEKINIIEIDEHLDQLAKPLHEKINAGMEEYGLTVPEFYITNVALPEDDPNYKRIKSLMASSYLGVKEAELEATLIAARRAAVLETEQALTAKKQMELQRDILSSQAAAQQTTILAEANANAMRQTGFADADVMSAKGYNQKDVLQAEVQKAYAEGIGQFGSNAGGGGGSGIAGEMLQMQMGMMAAGAMGSQMKDMMNGFTGNVQSNNAQTAQPQAETITCPECGTNLPKTAKFCHNCGKKIENLSDNEMICPHCGKKTLKGKFCSECGKPLVNKCPKCGTDLAPGTKFCPECGEKVG